MHRNKFEILADLLDQCQTPKPITRLMYQPTGSTTYERLKDQISLCLQKGLLSQKEVRSPHNNRGITLYATTAKGLLFIKHVRKLQEVIKKEKS